MSIGSKIKDLCADHGISIKRLAEDIYVSKDSLYSYTYERCYPNAEVLHDIAKYFDVPMEYFWND